MYELLGAGDEPIRRIHRYDSKGHRVETRSGMHPLSNDVKTMAYNEHGDRVEEVFESEEWDRTMDNGGRLSDIPTKERSSRTIARFLYDYDAHGNWVRKTVESRRDTDDNFTRGTVEQRTIGYYE